MEWVLQLQPQQYNMIIAYINIHTLEYPLFIGDLRLENLEQGQNNQPDPDMYAPVNAIEFPNIDSATQVVDELQPELIGDLWMQRLIVRNMTQQELDAKEELKKLILEESTQMLQEQSQQNSNSENQQLNISVSEI